MMPIFSLADMNLWGGHFAKTYLITVKAPRDLRKKSDWFRCGKISQKLKYLNFKSEQRKSWFSADSIDFTDVAHVFRMATDERWEWNSGLTVREINHLPHCYGDWVAIVTTLIPYFLLHLMSG